MKNIKIIWDEDSESNDIKTRINHFTKKNNIDLDKINEQLEKTCYKQGAIFPRPVIFKNIKVNHVFYARIVFNKATIYSREKLPPSCLHQPKMYKISILDYDPKNKHAKLFVKKR